MHMFGTPPLGQVAMTLRIRITTFVAILFSALGIVLFTSFNGPILNNFRKLELETVGGHVDRMVEAISANGGALQQKCSEWAHWDEIYGYVTDWNDSFAESNLVLESFQVSNLAHIVFLAPSGEVTRGFRISEDGTAITSLTDQELKDLDSLKSHFVISSPTGQVGGLIKLGAEIYLFAGSAITDSKIVEPPNGILLFTRRFDAELERSIATTTKLNITFSKDPLQRNSIDSVLLDSWPNKPAIKAFFSETVETVEAIGILPSVDGQDILISKIVLPRAIYQQGTAVRNYVGLAVLVATVLGACTTLIFINFIVLRPLRRIGREASAIGVGCDGKQRVSENLAPEFRILASRINEMLSGLDSARESVELARDTAQAANAAKSTFLAKISHELRTPIHGILGMHRMALKREKSRAIRELIVVADNCAQGLLTTINEILDFSKAESGNLTVEKIPVIFRDVVRASMQVVSGRLEGKEDLSLVCDIHPQVPDVIPSDPVRLQQVLVNLLGNAVKFTEAGSVTLRVSYVNGIDGTPTLRLEVADTGIGIPQEKLADIFEPFIQADDTSTRKYQGTGLGLAIVRQFCDKVGGAISVTSKVGVGTTFSVTIPIPDTPPREVNLLECSSSWPIPLLVCRQSLTLQVLKRNFKDLGLSVVWVDSDSPFLTTELGAAIERTNLLVVFDEALRSSVVFNTVVARVRAEDRMRESCTVAVLHPSNIEVRQRLYEEGLAATLTGPVLCDDILDVFFGRFASTEVVTNECVQPLRFDRPLRILVADDSAPNKVILEDMLVEVGHEVVSVSSGLDIVTHLAAVARGEAGAKPFDIVLTDIQMPGMDGFTAVRTVREIERAAGLGVHTPIIAVTAHALKQGDPSLQEAGIDGVVVKPIEPRLLASEVSRLLSNITTPLAIHPRMAETSVVQLDVHLDQYISELLTQIFAQREVKTGTDVAALNPSTVLNLPTLYRRLGRSLTRTKLVLDASETSVKDQLAALNTAVAGNSPEDLRRVAHALRGLLLDVGATQSGQTATEIENLCEAGRIADAIEKVPSLREEAGLVIRLIPSVSNWLGSIGQRTYQADVREKNQHRGIR
jgi:signal transduction histidine kinase/CheY-like chemotaxis protein/HPt (histidine-containing phosphotransfer) domain-containing protein